MEITLNLVKKWELNNMNNTSKLNVDSNESSTQDVEMAEKDLVYEVADDIDNKADAEVSGAEDSGANLKGILQNLISKCSTYGASMAELSDEFDGYIDAFNEAGDKLNIVGDNIKALVEKYGDDLESIKAQIESRQKELEAKEAEYKATMENNSPENAEKRATLKEEIQGLNDSIGDLQNLYNYKSLDGKNIVEQQQAVVEQAGNNVNDIRAKITTANKEIEVAEQYSEKTIEQGTKATEISSKKEARKAGFKGIFKRGVKKAHKMGNQAINVGKELHTSTTENAAKSVKISETQGIHAQMTTKFLNMAEEAGYSFRNSYQTHAKATRTEATADEKLWANKNKLPEEEA